MTDKILSGLLRGPCRLVDAIQKGLGFKALSEDLSWAVGGGDLAEVERLLALGVDPNAPAHGIAPLSVALERLAPRARDSQAVGAAVAIVKALLDAGADPDADSGALVCAAIDLTVAPDESARSVEYLRLILDAGATVNMTGWHMGYAVARDAGSAVCLLMKHGAWGLLWPEPESDAEMEIEAEADVEC